MVDDECHLLISCSMYKVIHEKYDDLLDEHDNVNVILKCPPRRVSTYVWELFSRREILLQSNSLIMDNKTSILCYLECTRASQIIHECELYCLYVNICMFSCISFCIIRCA